MNLGLLLDMAAEGYGDRPVLGTERLTARDVRALAAAGAHEVRAAGSDSVVYLAGNGPAFAVALFAAALAGVPLVPLNYRLGQEQLDALLSAHPRAFGIAKAGQQEALGRAGLVSRTPEEWLASLSPRDEVVPVDSDEPAVVIYTSGTTSVPKGVLLRHANLVSYVLDTVEFASAGVEEAALMSMPPYHVAAVANVLTNLYAGRRSIVLEQFDAARWLEVAQAEAVTQALVVPTMLSRILDLPGHEELPALRSLAYGGAPMPRRLVERALAAWPHVDFANAYGLTETSSTICVLGPAEHREALAAEDPAVRARLSSVGRPVPSVELEVRAEDGTVLAPFATGRVWVRGAQVSGEYSGTGTALDERGFFDTRDVGHLDEAGYLFLGGRADDTIIRGGENIAPAEIEDVLLRHPAVADAVVVGVPDEEWGHRVEAAVVAQPGASVQAEELREHVRRALRGSKTPERVVFWPDLPRNDTGKLVRRLVVQRLQG